MIAIFGHPVLLGYNSKHGPNTKALSKGNGVVATVEIDPLGCNGLDLVIGTSMMGHIRVKRLKYKANTNCKTSYSFKSGFSSRPPSISNNGQGMRSISRMLVYRERRFYNNGIPEMERVRQLSITSSSNITL